MTKEQIDAEILASNVQSVMLAWRKHEQRRVIAMTAHSGK